MNVRKASAWKHIDLIITETKVVFLIVTNEVLFLTNMSSIPQRKNIELQTCLRKPDPCQSMAVLLGCE